jgi:hypothetical protein
MQPGGEPDVPVHQRVPGQIVLGDVREGQNASDKNREQTEERPCAPVARKAADDAARIGCRGERHQLP